MSFQPTQSAENFGWNKSATIALLFVVAGLCAALRLWNLTAHDFWADEIFTLAATGQSWNEMFRTLIADRVHPPLFYVLLKIWRLGGESVWWLRLFSVCFAVLTIFPFYFLCRELRLNQLETTLALLLTTTNFYLIYYAQELRMYSQLWFFAVCSLWLFVRLNNAKASKNAVLFVLFAVNLLLVYTHYFGWLVVGFQGLYLLLENRRQFLMFAASASALAACFAPWAYFVGRQIAEKRGIENLSWLEAPSFGALTGFFATLNGTFNVAGITIVHLTIFGSLICLASWRVLKSVDGESRRTWLMLVFFAFSPVLLIFAVSRFAPIWDYRYLIVVAAAYFVLLAKSAAQFENLVARRIVVAIVLTWAFSAGFYNLTKPNKRIAWSKLVEQARRAENDGSANVRTKIYTLEPWETVPINFYLDKSGDEKFQVVQIESLDDIKDKHFWMAVRDTAWKLETSPQNFWAGKNCRLGYEQEFLEQQQKITLFEVEVCP